MKRIFSWILAFAMLCGMMPMSAFATEDTVTEETQGKDFSKLTYVAFGDSITYGVDGNYRGNEAGRYMENPYPKLVGELLNFGTVSNLAVSGGTLCADSGRTNMTERILQFNGKANVISIMLGVNDYAVGCPMGDIDSTDNKTIYGSLNLICQHLTEAYPNAFVFFMTPFQFRGGENDRGAGYNLPAVANAIKDVAAMYQIPVLDMYTYGKYEEEFNDPSLAYQDGIHPSQQHHIQYTAPMIAEFITENYTAPDGDDGEDDQPENNGRIIYSQQNLIKGYCPKDGNPVASSVHSYFTMDAEGIQTITITPPDAPAWNPLDIYYIVVVQEDGTVSCYGKLDKQEPTVVDLGGNTKGTVYFNAFYDDHPEYVYVKEAIVVSHKHEYETVVTEPTCTESGYTVSVCKGCGDSHPEPQTIDITNRFHWNEGYVISATGGGMSADTNWVASDYVDISAFDSIEIVTGDTVNAGTTLGIAFYDANKTYVSGVVHTDKTGTDYGILVHNLEVPDNVVYLRTTWYSVHHEKYAGATLHTFYCKGTGTSIPALGHRYTLTEETAPTCTAQGMSVYTCSVCGDSRTESINRLEHTYDGGVCTVCGVSILGNDWIAPDFADGDYTMVVLPDTQNLVDYWPEIYYNQMQWIADNQDALNIQAVLHVGDMVNTNNSTQWTVCETGTDILNAAGIPWMPMRGNHDDSAWFNKYYDYATYGANQSWFGGSYHEDKLDHTYWFVTAGEREYLILSLGWAPSWDVLEWAKGIVAEHDDKSVILVDHAYMNQDGTLLSQGDAHCVSSYYPGYPDGDDIWAAFKDYGNIVLAMGGHIHSPDVIPYVDQNSAGRDVTSLLFDRQNDDITNRYAMIALLTFHTDSNSVDINWYSTRYDALFRAKNQFSITVPDVCAHSYTSAIVEPTCTEQGFTTHTCTICGDSYVDDYVDALGHDYSAGLCTVCGEDTVSVSLDGNRFTLTGAVEDGTEIIAAYYGSDGRFTGSKCLIWQGSTMTETIPAEGNVKLFFHRENWQPLRQAVPVK